MVAEAGVPRKRHRRPFTADRREVVAAINRLIEVNPWYRKEDGNGGR